MCKRGNTPLVELKEDTVKKSSGCENTTHTRGDDEILDNSADSGGGEEEDRNDEKALIDEENVVLDNDEKAE